MKITKYALRFIIVYIIASIVLSLVWYRNLGSYDGKRYGLLIVEPFIKKISDEYIGDKIVGWDSKKEYFWTYDSSKFSKGDTVLTVLVLNPFTNYDDDGWFSINLKI